MLDNDDVLIFFIGQIGDYTLLFQAGYTNLCNHKLAMKTLEVLKSHIKDMRLDMVEGKLVLGDEYEPKNFILLSNHLFSVREYKLSQEDIDSFLGFERYAIISFSNWTVHAKGSLSEV
ncbi:hypothetical protein JOC36_001529 [Weissella uvarum]|uniref:hypothetical protein n=1 Tax=Weissella uvarum TaxID=1479233 RepID=UPI00195FA652|nr:hypothetical protein [Weissella uvarum]MBM7617936.1 hypothetical protein [Weissella uvarum]MCM0595251.1 hypothetical protein [Weissella uvarum]